MSRYYRSFLEESAVSNYSLDAYGTPVVWYEMVKRFSAYSGPCIRVRRSSDNAEQNIGFVNDLLDTASLLSFVGAGNGFVTTFYTQVGTKNVTNATATQQPQIVSSGALITRNGFVSIKYDGSNDNLFNWSSGFVNTSDVSYFSVSQNDVANSNGTIHTQGQTSNASVRTFCDRRVNKLHLAISNSTTTYVSTLSIQRDDSNLRLLSSFVNSSKQMSSFDNGETGSTDTWTGTNNSEGLQLGQQHLSTWLNGSINCFGAYNTDNSANRVAIETILNNYYNIY
jgi:hypothetical protein